MSEILQLREIFGTHEKKTERIVTEETFSEDLGTFGQFWAVNFYGEDWGFIRGESGEIPGKDLKCRIISGVTVKVIGGNFGEI